MDMKNLLFNETELLESKDFRDKLISRTDVLDKIKELLLIPKTDFANVKQVSEFYEVAEESIKTVINRHSDELYSDGMKNLNSNQTKEYLASFNMKPTNFRGYFEFEGIKFSNKSNLFISRRAILRIGMLLRDSDIAKEIRNQLLNIEEKTSIETKTQDINEEQKLILEVGMAFASGNTTALMIATTNMMAFKNRHITKLEQSNKALANGILKWEDRSRINFAVRKLVQTAHLNYGELWNELYKQLKNKYHMDLKARGKQPWIKYVKEEEWNNVIKCFSALCEYYGQTSADMFCDLVVQEVSANV
jgi:hypothetical protein